MRFGVRNVFGTSLLLPKKNKKPKTPEEQEGDHFPPLEVNAVHAWNRLDEANSMSLPKP